MTKHGWKEGQSLGNRSSAHVGLNDVDRLAAARVGVLFKDDNLGLGAKRKSKDLEGQRTGLDAFQGLLGRLNGKTDQELEKEEKKIEDRKLEMYAKGRWGGMVFIKGGTLVGDRDFGTGEGKDETTTSPENDSTPEQSTSERENKGTTADTEAEKKQRKEEKRQRKEARKLRREENALRKAARKAKQQGKATQSDSGDEDDQKDDSEPTPFLTHKAPPVQAPDEPVSSSSGNEDSKSSKLKRKRSSSKIGVPEPSKQKPTAPTPLRNGRHLLRGRNIQAKKMAFADMKGLEEIFMKTG